MSDEKQAALKGYNSNTSWYSNESNETIHDHKTHSLMSDFLSTSAKKIQIENVNNYEHNVEVMEPVEKRTGNYIVNMAHIQPALQQKNVINKYQDTYISTRIKY